MKTSVKQSLLAGLLLVCCLAGGARAGDLTVAEAWIREAPPTAAVHAGYLTLSNGGEHVITITGVYSPDYEAAEIHRSWVEDGIARMQALEQLEVAPGETVRLEPGGNHLMLFRPQRMLRSGDTVTLRLATSSDDCVEVSAVVRRADDTPAHAH